MNKTAMLSIFAIFYCSIFISFPANANNKAADQHTYSLNKHAEMRYWKGMKLKVTNNGLTVDDKPAAVSDSNKEATVYQQGLFSYIVYANGKIAVMDDRNQFQGYVK